MDVTRSPILQRAPPDFPLKHNPTEAASQDAAVCDL